METPHNRRAFLSDSTKISLGVASGVTILANSKSARATPANDRLVLGLVGVGPRGKQLAGTFLNRDDCEFAYLCDVDRLRSTARVDEYANLQGGKRAKCVQDFREILQDDSVDAVVLAIPPHWHALATILCCQAGKDVYCEKPQSHSIWESRQAIRAARKYDRIVQIGTQNRSAPYNLAAKRYLAEGKLGKVHLCHVVNQYSSGDFRMGSDSAAPENLDWNMWCGPAPNRKYNKSLYNNGWRHFWDYSGGDMAWQGIHQLDLARMLCNVDYPSTVFSTGGHFNSQDNAETPDTQSAVFKFPNMLMTYEQTLYTPYMLRSDGGIRNGDIFPHWPQNSTRVELYGERGVMYIGRMGGGWQVYIRPKSRKPVLKDEMFGRFPDADHIEDFVSAVRSRKRPNADIEVGHRSMIMVHYANISHRLDGRTLRIDPHNENVIDDPEAMSFFRRTYREPWVVKEQV